MRYSQITESTQVMDVLSACADLIMQLTPKIIRDGEVTRISLGSYSNEREIEKLLDQFGSDPRFAEGIHHLRYLEVIIDNLHPSSVKGAYSHLTIRRDATLSVYCKIRSNEAEWGKPLYTTHRAGEQGIRVDIRSTIIHELRHHFQRFSYGKYYKKKIDHENYHTNPIEIDAAWFHHIEEFSVNDYDTAQAYANAVMLAFVEYKHMTNQDQIRHYFRKTVKYWLARKHPDKPDMALAARVEERRKKETNNILAMLPPIEMIDLRDRIEGYNGDNFFIQSRIISGVRNLITHNVISHANEFLVYLVLALGHAEPAIVRAFVERITGRSLSDALEDYPFPEGWDRAAITRFIEQKFR